jgi:acetyl esterase/lipase
VLAKEYNVDTSRIVTWRESAGSHLALTTGMDPRLPAGSKSTRTEAKMAATETDPSFFLDE